MRRLVRNLALTLTASCWIATGLGAAALQASAVCRHGEHHHAAGGGHRHDSPPGTCYCDAMNGHGITPATPIATPEPPISPVALPAERVVSTPEPAVSASRAPRGPEPPPPISA